MWDSRFSMEEYVYGTEPNVYLKKKLEGMEPGMILFPAEGEGRNAIYAASKGWVASAFDISEEGKKKAIALSRRRTVRIDYNVGQLPELGYEESSFDVIALIYAHFPPELREEYFSILDSLLKPGGRIIMEVFGERHLEYRENNPSIGGPGTRELLFSVDEVKAYFPDYEFIELEERPISLSEGAYHVGEGSVLRMEAIKKDNTV